MEMPICQVRQTVELIRQRRTEEARLQMRITEWQTKQLAAVSVNLAVDVADQGRKAAMRNIQAMTLDARDEVEVEADPGTDFSYIDGGEDGGEGPGAVIDESRMASAEMFQMVAAGGPR